MLSRSRRYLAAELVVRMGSHTLVYSGILAEPGLGSDTRIPCRCRAEVMIVREVNQGWLQLKIISTYSEFTINTSRCQWRTGNTRISSTSKWTTKEISTDKAMFPSFLKSFLYIFQDHWDSDIRDMSSFITLLWPQLQLSTLSCGVSLGWSPLWPGPDCWCILCTWC